MESACEISIAILFCIKSATEGAIIKNPQANAALPDFYWLNLQRI